MHYRNLMQRLPSPNFALSLLTKRMQTAISIYLIFVYLVVALSQLTLKRLSFIGAYEPSSYLKQSHLVTNEKRRAVTFAIAQYLYKFF